MRTSYAIPWRVAPFLRILAAYIPGVIAACYLRLPIYVIFSLLLILAGICLTNILRTSHTIQKYQALKGTAVYGMVFCTAICITYYSDSRNSNQWYGHYLSPESILRVRITEPPVEKNKSFRYPARVEAVEGVDLKLKGYVVLYVDKQIKQILHPGQRIYMQNKMQPIPRASSPGAFDYGRYMSRKGYYHSAWIQSADFIISSQPPRQTNQWLFQCRSALLNILSHHFKDPRILGVAEALLIGYKEHLNPELKAAFTETGVIHVIAISGLHLGLIYVALIAMLKKIRWIWKQALLRTVLVLGALWIFALLTGAPASVLRSAVMFSCMLIGESYFRKSSVYNSMAASAFLLLCYDPFYLWDPGFLLSYLAVLGIVALQRPFFTSVYFKWKPLRMLWSLITVSLAAQIATLPVCLLYFKQFPNYFLITNLVVVPLSTCILFAEIILVAFAWCPGITYWAMITEWMIHGMNSFIEFCSRLPYALTAPVYATVYSTWMMGIAFACLAWGVLRRQKMAIHLAVIAAIFFSGGYVFETFRRTHQRKMLVYNATGSTSIDIMYNNRFLYVGDSILSRGSPSYEFVLQPARVHYRTSRPAKALPAVFIRKEVISLAGKHWLRLSGKYNKLHLIRPVSVEGILVSHNAPVPDSALLAALQLNQVVLDATNSLWKIEEWKKACEKLLLPCHSVSQNGTFSVNW